MDIGLVGVLLGAGRNSVEESVDFSSGVEFHARPGMQVQVGDHLATIYTERAAVLQSAVLSVQSAITILVDEVQPAPPSLVTHFITKNSVEEFDQAVFDGN